MQLIVLAPALVWPLLGGYLLFCLVSRRRPHSLISAYLLAATALATAIYSSGLGDPLSDTFIYVTWAPVLTVSAAIEALKLGMFVGLFLATVGFSGAIIGILRSGTTGRLLIPLLAGPAICLAAIWAQSAVSWAGMMRASGGFYTECRELRSLRETLAGMSSFKGNWFFQDYHGTATSGGQRFLWSYASGGWVELGEEQELRAPFPDFPASCNR